MRDDQTTIAISRSLLSEMRKLMAEKTKMPENTVESIPHEKIVEWVFSGFKSLLKGEEIDE